MRTAQLLRLYPRAWRERYGEEFLALAGDGALGAQQTFDLLCGAIDAWLSADVRRAAAAGHVVSREGGTAMLKSLLACERVIRYTVRDSLMAAAVIIGVTFVLMQLGHLAGAGGWTATSDVLTRFAFLAAFTLSFPFWVMKGQPWKAQAAIMGTTLTFLALVGYLG